MVPTVTNVNNASIITCSFPELHGITTNWFYDPETGLEVFMDSSKFLMCETYLEKAAQRGQKTLLLTAKDKLRRLLAKDCDKSYSVERPDPRISEELKPPPGIYEPDASPWLLRAAAHEIASHEWDIVYVSTTDFIPHMYSPKDPEAREYMSRIDEAIESIYSNGCILGVVADHGMNAKSVNIDPTRLLQEHGVSSKMVESIKDEHVVHHQNLGGSVYLYVSEAEKALAILREAEGVEAVFRRDEAAREFRLMRERIGDLLLIADRDHTFGPNEKSVYRDIGIRSHGSLHENEVPFILGIRIETKEQLYNKDVIPALTAARIDE
jgi:phosphonoacetate hydrolase